VSAYLNISASTGLIAWTLPSGPRVVPVHTDEQLALACGRAYVELKDWQESVMTTKFDVSRADLAQALSAMLREGGLERVVQLAFPDDPLYLETLNHAITPKTPGA
jgi:hypothetical protein